MVWVILLVYLVIWARGVLPRYRYDQLLLLGWKSYIPVTISLLVLVLGVI